MDILRRVGGYSTGHGTKITTTSTDRQKRQIMGTVYRYVWGMNMGGYSHDGSRVLLFMVCSWWLACDGCWHVNVVKGRGCVVNGGMVNGEELFGKRALVND